ncbi:hypothetical protein C1645_870508 [Glomus cerebriforme]|uniref:Transmembrane protein n=1 Tax=Glomus cerebriforme TaxID=658196 RepID=A0A397TKH6_9GLOM|nr:hypothetical protein C1645_870508 [Glomus cerebriforme]
MSQQQQEQSWATAKDDSIITMTANTLLENIVLFFMTVFVLLCGSNTSTPLEIQIHHFFIPQQNKLYNLIKTYSSKQESLQSLSITDHSHNHNRNHKKNPSIVC